MRLQARLSTEDKRLTKGKIYECAFVWIGAYETTDKRGLRVVAWDNTGEWMTFNPEAFVPHGEI